MHGLIWPPESFTIGHASFSDELLPNREFALMKQVLCNHLNMHLVRLCLQIESCITKAQYKRSAVTWLRVSASKLIGLCVCAFDMSGTNAFSSA